MRGGAGRSYPTLQARGGGQEDQPHVQGAMAVRVQEGLEELSHPGGERESCIEVNRKMKKAQSTV